VDYTNSFFDVLVTTLSAKDLQEKVFLEEVVGQLLEQEEEQELLNWGLF